MKKLTIRIGLSLFLSAALLLSIAGPVAAQDSGPVGSATGSAVPVGDPGPTGDEILAQIQANAAAAEPAAPDEVLGISVTSADQLAFTGSTVNTTLAVGSIMIGAGGMLLLAARKREQA